MFFFIPSLGKIQIFIPKTECKNRQFRNQECENRSSVKCLGTRPQAHREEGAKWTFCFGPGLLHKTRKKGKKGIINSFGS